jgi:hypothetical protein
LTTTSTWTWKGVAGAGRLMLAASNK